LTKKPLEAVAGTLSCSSSRRFAVNVSAMKVVTVTLPPGRLRFATRPISTESALSENTISAALIAIADQSLGKSHC
jgi:hypothetical protein